MSKVFSSGSRAGVFWGISISSFRFTKFFFTSSLSSKSLITPYSPSYPVCLITLPCLRREIPSPRSGESFERSSIGISRRIESSEPNLRINLSYSVTTDLLCAPTQLISAIISCSGTRLKTSPAVDGLNVLSKFLSASVQTLFKTPIVKGFPHTGQMLLNFKLS